MHPFFNIVKKFKFESRCACLHMTKVKKKFQNTWTKGYHIFETMVIVR